MSHQVAQEIVAYCPSCKMDLMHVIVAMDVQKIVRVICLTCRKEHGFHRPHESAPLPKAAAKRSKVPATAKPHAAAAGKPRTASRQWNELVEQQKDIAPKPYSIQGSFSTGDKLEHTRFGIGFVTRIIEPDKIEVLFRQGQKRMAFRGR